MLLNRSAVPAALLLLVAACSAPPQPASPAAQAPISFDGGYTGTVRVTGIGAGGETVRGICNTSPKFAVTVTNNAFIYAQPHPRYPGRPVVTYSVVISPGGYVSGTSDRNGTFDGRIVDGTLTATINGSGCFYAVSARRF